MIYKVEKYVFAKYVKEPRILEISLLETQIYFLFFFYPRKATCEIQKLHFARSFLS